MNEIITKQTPETLTETPTGPLTRARSTALRLAAAISGFYAMFVILNNFAMGKISVVNEVILLGFGKITLPFDIPTALNAIPMFILVYALVRLIPTSRVRQNLSVLVGAFTTLIMMSQAMIILGAITLNSAKYNDERHVLWIILGTAALTLVSSMVNVIYVNKRVVWQMAAAYWFHVVLIVPLLLLPFTGLRYSIVPMLIAGFSYLVAHPHRLIHRDTDPALLMMEKAEAEEEMAASKSPSRSA